MNETISSVDFKLFGNAVRDRYDAIKSAELYTVDAGRDEIWQAYLGAFPDGSNPIFRERTEHDCSCCKNFIRNIGHVVSITGNEMHTVWDISSVGYPYDQVAASMRDYILSCNLNGVYRTTESQYGAEMTPELRDGQTIRWNHFSGSTNKDHKLTKERLGPFKSDMESAYQVMNRGLDEITDAALTDVIELINDGALYRGNEHKAAIDAFRDLRNQYTNAGNHKELFIWQNLKNPAARFRNTVIGTLLTDLSTGVELEDAVKMFESKVAPENYKRPTALITPRMIDSALASLDELGLRDSINRRHAVIGDLSVNDVLFVDNSVESLMKDSLKESLMQEAVQSPVVVSDPVEVTAQAFFNNILPSATSISALFEHSKANNLMTLTAPADDSPGLFKWDNGLAWSYNGDLADSSLRQEVAAKGGRVDGVFRFSHTWNYAKRNASLMDLHVFMPGCGIKADNPTNDRYGNDSRVGWNNRNHHKSGGVQDVDYVNPAPAGYVPVENISFPDGARMPDGDYICKIHNWKSRSPNESGFKAEIEFNGQVFEYEMERPLKHKEWITVAVITKKGSVFSIEHKMKSSYTQRDIWGLTTGQLIPIDCIAHSPNYWDTETGNKHTFFLLKGCLNPDPVRGIYNEYLNNGMAKHRKVFEVLASKTKAPYQDSQLSGVGFSSSKHDSLTVVVKGESSRAYKINF